MKGNHKDRDPSDPGTLILTRKIGERIYIGSDVSVQLIDIRGGQAKIGVSAPRDVAVHREEIFKRLTSSPP
ncbi:MAG: carbon storage regulator CsrA [Chloroflexota bacterium]